MPSKLRTGSSNVKLALIIGLLSIPVTIVISRLNSLFFGIFLGCLLFITAMIVMILFSSNETLRHHSAWLLSIIILNGIFIRYYQFQFPASLVGSDPDQRAIWIRSIIRTGSTSVLDAGFYSDAPLSLIYGAISYLIAGLPRAGLGIYAIVLGIFIPITGLIFGKKISGDYGFKVGLLSAVLASVIPFTVKQGFWPIPQSHGIVLLISAFLVLHLTLSTKKIHTVPLLVLLFGGITFTHKSQLFFWCGSIMMIFLLEYIFIRHHKYQNRISKVRQITLQPIALLIIGVLILIPWIVITSIYSPIKFQVFSLVAFSILVILTVESKISPGIIHKSTYQPINKYLIIIGWIFLLLQAIFISNFVEVVIIDYILRFFIGFSVTPPSATINPKAAISVSYGIYDIFMHRGSSLILLLFVTYCSIVQMLYGLQNSRVVRIITPVLFVIVLTPTSITAVTETAAAGGIGVQRLFPAFIPMMSAVIGAQCVKISKIKIRNVDISPNYAIFGILLILCVFQIGSPLFTPGYPMQQRQYLTDSEVEGKDFTNQYVNGEVHTDKRYAYESIAPVKEIGYVPHGNLRSEYYFEDENPIYIPNSEGYLNGELGTRNENYILHRPTIEYYTVGIGLWKLKYDVDNKLSSKFYSKVYSNSGSSLYWH